MNGNELKEEQNKLLEDYDNAKAALLPFDNVVAVGIGLKETNGKFTEEISYRIFVMEKKDESDLDPSQVIPKNIYGTKTDVITVYMPIDRAFVERLDTSEHRPIKAGIAVGNERFPNRAGTLGWFATLGDGTNIVLTNKHVLYDKTLETNTAHVKFAQTFYSKSCCCECGVIGETIIGIKNALVDCGIAKINTDINRELVINNKNTTEILRVSNTTTAAAVVGERVRKIGARSAFTRGTVVHIGDAAAASVDSGGTNIVVMPDQVLIVPVNDETYEIETGKKAFSNSGDSGSIILNNSDQIVALLWGGDSTTNNVDITWASNIAHVLSTLSTAGFPITLTPSPPAGGRSMSRVNRSPITVNELLSVNIEFIQDTENHRLLKLVNIHRSEVTSLINTCRPVKVAWNRFYGPGFAAHFMNSAKDPSYKFPKEVKGISFQTLLINMGDVLRKHGSESLRKDIETHGFEVMALAEKSGSVHELIEKISAEAPSEV